MPSPEKQADSDCTHKKQTPSDLHSAVMASCRDAIISYSPDGMIEAWNRGAEEIYGFSREEAIGSCADLTVPKERSDELERLAETTHDGQSVEHFETVRLRKSGQAFPASVCGFPIHSSDNQVVGYATIERDISDRVHASDALREAVAAAEEAALVKANFLANVSHELRTPMNAIIGMTALALEEELTPELRDYLETIRDSSDAMLHLVNDVLDLSKFESERFELDQVEFDLRELTEGTTKVLGTAAHAKGLELVCHVAPDTPTVVLGDPIRLRQVLANLVGNAIKFTASGEVMVDVAPVSIDKEHCQIRFRVVDTGIGISEENQKNIFAPFEQVDSAMTRRYAGSGLGLTISRHLISCFESELKVDSHPGQGSCFSFAISFPLVKTNADEQTEQVSQQLNGLSVLVADDNLSSRETLVEQFKAWQMNAQAADSGKMAIQMLTTASEAGKPFDVAVIDALMPGIDGFSVAAAIENDSKIKTKLILMASVTDRLEFSRRCAEAGVFAFVQKPVSQSQLLGAVAQAAGGSTLHGEDRNQLLSQSAQVAPLKVLLVEDTPANRKVVQRVLGKRGHRVEIAINGREAIDAFRQQAFDLILMDVQMPIMDGLQATEAIREIERTNESVARIPIIAMTAHSLRGDRERCLRSGMDAYVSKPLDLQRLINLVESTSLAAPVATNGTSLTDPLTNGAAMNRLDENKMAIVQTPETIAEHPLEDRQLDLTIALSRLRGDQSLLLDMISFYEEDYRNLIAMLRESVEASDLATAERAAHSLKGLASTFDASECVAVAREAEIAAREGDAAKVTSLIEPLAKEAEWLATALQAYRSSAS